MTSPRTVDTAVVGPTVIRVKLTLVRNLIKHSNSEEDTETERERLNLSLQVLGESIKLFTASFWVVNPGELGARSQQ